MLHPSVNHVNLFYRIVSYREFGLTLDWASRSAESFRWAIRSAETFSSAIRSTETKKVTLTFGSTLVLVLTWDWTNRSAID